MTTFEALAVPALRVWCVERGALGAGSITSYRTSGTQRHPAHLHSRKARVLSFEQVFQLLPDPEQTALLLAYRDGFSAARIAAVMRWRSAPVAQARLAQARWRLADSLDRRHLL